MSNKNTLITKWVTDYTDELLNWAIYKTNNRTIAEDFVQETFIAAFNNIENFKGDSSPKTWLFSILKNKVADYFRKKIRQNTLNESEINTKDDSKNLMQFFNSNGEWLDSAKPSDWDINSEELLDNEDFNQILKACMELLNETSLLSIQYKYLEEKEGKLICQELGISPSNFWQIMHRAKLQLRQCIENNWTD